jgi:hypothetical protein
VHDCNETFLFGKHFVNIFSTLFSFSKPFNQGTWDQNICNCTSIGMEAIVLSDVSAHSCLKKQSYCHQILVFRHYTQHLFVSNTVGKWKYHANYWTGGMRLANSTFSWCNRPKEELVPVVSSNFEWGFKQPDNFNASENCLHMLITRKNSSLLLSDRMCTERHFFACKVVIFFFLL